MEITAIPTPSKAPHLLNRTLARVLAVFAEGEGGGNWRVSVVYEDCECAVVPVLIWNTTKEG